MRAILRFLSIPCAVGLAASVAKPAGGQCVSTSGVLVADGGTLPSDPSTTACDLPHNDLLPASISLQGLSEASPFLEALANGPLDDHTLLRVSANLDDEHVKVNVGRLLGKIVSCALDRGTKLSDVAGIALRGELGLCAEWANSSLSPSRKPVCLQVVSSCVLARVNAIGARVILSLRASDPALRSLRVRDPELLKTRDAVPVENRYRENHGTPIPSFERCAPSGSQANCGFLRGFVGQCIPNRAVRIAASPPGTTIRVCKGLYGCDKIARSPRWPIRAYAGLVRQGVDSLNVVCPMSGYYGVMVKPPSQAKPAVKVTSKGGTYPAREEQVFTFAEGAFYGNLFDTNKSLDRCAGGQMLAGDQYACFSNGWNSGVDQINDRYCNLGTGSNCLVNQPMPCFRESGAADNRCESDALSGLAFARCKATFPAASGPPPGLQVPWEWALTTYLNNPCDLSSDPACDPDSVYHPRPEHDSKSGRRTGTHPPKPARERDRTAHALGN
jgi:hypothetical protein